MIWIKIFFDINLRNEVPKLCFDFKIDFKLA
jgi:hypothetical protein